MKKPTKKTTSKAITPPKGPIKQHKLMAMGKQPKILSSPKTPA
jgi:hypothetical protein